MTELIVLHPVPLDQNPAAVYLASLNTKDGRRTMRQALDRMAELLTGTPDAMQCRWGAVRFQHTMAMRSQLMEQYRPATVNKYLSALRGVLKAAWLLGQMDAESYQKAIAVKGIKNTTLPTGREVVSDEITALIAVCKEDDGPSRWRDIAMIAVLYGAGLRRAELVGLDMAQYDQRQGKLIVRGKGQKERTAWLSKSINQTLVEWVNLRGAWAGPLFCPISKSHNIMSRRLTTQAVYYILQKRCEQADVSMDISPHDFRRTFVSDLLDRGVDIATVSRMAGHANVQTTARYDRRGEETKRDAAEKLQLPTGDD